MASSRCKTWFYRVGQLFVSIDHAYLLGAENVNTRSVLLSIEAELKVISDIAWKEKLNANSAIRGNAQGGNKQRTYSQFKGGRHLHEIFNESIIFMSHFSIGMIDIHKKYKFKNFFLNFKMAVVAGVQKQKKIFG